MKKLKLRKWVKYTILAIIDFIIILNLPNLIKEPATVNQYRLNIIIVACIIFFNTISISKIEK